MSGAQLEQCGSKHARAFALPFGGVWPSVMSGWVWCPDCGALRVEGGRWRRPGRRKRRQTRAERRQLPLDLTPPDYDACEEEDPTGS